MSNRNYYDILGVKYDATPEEITAAKNKLAKQYHPDVNIRKGIDTTEKMQEILEAYGVLSDKEKRAEYDRELRGTTSVMQTFDLSKSAEASGSDIDSGFVVFWKVANQLYNLVNESIPLMRSKENDKQVAKMAKQALKLIFKLRNANIPEKYWLPETMNWLLFQSYLNQNYTTSYLISLFDEHVKNDVSFKEKLKMQKQTNAYIHSIKKLLKH